MTARSRAAAFKDVARQEHERCDWVTLRAVTAYRQSEGVELGPLVVDARPNRGPATALMVLFLFIGLIIDVSALASPPTSFERWLVVIIFGVVFPALGLLGRFGRQPDAVRIHEQGFVSGPHAVRWEDIVEIVTKRHVAGNRTQKRSSLDVHTIKTKDGRTLDLRFGFVDNDAVLRQLHERTREHLLRATKLPAKFGAVNVDDTGVRTEFASLGWSQISRAALDGPASQVIVRGPGSAFIELPLHEVPNAHVMCALVNQRATAPTA